MSEIKLTIGEIYTSEFPFRKEKYFGDEFGWHPGCESETGEDERWFTAHGVGKRHLKIISMHRPSEKHHERVFYTKSYTSPIKETITKGELFVCTVGRFRKMTKGFGYEYEVEESKDPGL